MLHDQKKFFLKLQLSVTMAYSSYSAPFSIYICHLFRALPINHCHSSWLQKLKYKFKTCSVLKSCKELKIRVSWKLFKCQTGLTNLVGLQIQWVWGSQWSWVSFRHTISIIVDQPMNSAVALSCLRAGPHILKICFRVIPCLKCIWRELFFPPL